MRMWWQHKVMQPMKMDDFKLLPQPRSKMQKMWPWFSLSSTLIVFLAAFFFHLRWSRSISSSPINLPARRYIFTDHSDLRPFDQRAIDLWQVYAKDHWWSMEWRDPAGNRLTQGIDMLHKLHCLVAIREEFTLMATDEERHIYFNAHNAESLTRRLHIKHCFDFIRQDIMCAADEAVEPLGPGYTRSDGLGVEHECKDWDIILKYADSNHYFPPQLTKLQSSKPFFI